jgi:peptidoglycan/LPS O-acetylase OafA/YrhL
MTHVPEYDGWRGLAIALLLIGHFLPVPGIDFGIVGVSFFFVLSGHLMARILFVDKVPLVTFYRRRTARILPALWVYLAIVTAAHGVMHRPIMWQQVIASLDFTMNYFMGIPGFGSMPFGHIWSLSVEEHSYVVLSLIALGARMGLFGVQVALALIVALVATCGFAIPFIYSDPHERLQHSFHTEVASFGIAISALIVTIKRVPNLGNWSAVILMCAGIACNWWSQPLPVRTVIGVAFLALALHQIQYAAPIVRSCLRFAPLRKLGVYSFSIYLWQQPLYAWVGPTKSQVLLAMIGAIAVGIISFHFVEQPMRRYVNGYRSDTRTLGVLRGVPSED